MEPDEQPTEDVSDPAAGASARPPAVPDDYRMTPLDELHTRGRPLNVEPEALGTSRVDWQALYQEPVPRKRSAWEIAGVVLATVFVLSGLALVAFVVMFSVGMNAWAENK